MGGQSWKEGQRWWLAESHRLAQQWPLNTWLGGGAGRPELDLFLMPLVNFRWGSQRCVRPQLFSLRAWDQSGSQLPSDFRLGTREPAWMVTIRHTYNL